MSGITKRRLWSQLWDARSPSISNGTRIHTSTSTYLLYSRCTRKKFAQGTRQPLVKSAGAAESKSIFSRYARHRGFMSSGDLLFGPSPRSTATSSAITGRQPSYIARAIWTARSLNLRRESLIKSPLQRAIHFSTRGTKRPLLITQHDYTSGLSNRVMRLKSTNQSPEPQTPDNLRHDVPEEAKDVPDTANYFHLPHLPHLPKMPHRPTKEELLAAATGFWSRLKVRFKWFSIRSVRPWNVDDWSAFVSWLVVGHIVWVLVGTTTFFSILIFAINTVVAQETLARWVGDYLTQSAGIKVVFENAIVPKWKDGVISFRNVFVSRRPGQGASRVTKGSSMTAAAAAAAKRQAELGEIWEEEDTNYTQFDVTIDTVNVTLSFVKWWNGRGLLRDVEVKGVRGVVDRTSVDWGDDYVDPRTYKHKHALGDFEIDNFKMEDLLLTIYQPKGFRPFSVSIYICELPQLRKQWLFYDFLSANQMSGSFDGSLFNIHPHQTHSPTHSAGFEEPELWKKHSRLRIDGLKIDHLNRGVDGPFGWIHEGNVDIVADIMFPADSDGSIAKVVSDLYDRMEATVTSNRYIRILENHPENADLNTPEQRAFYENQKHDDDDKRFLIMDLRVHLNDVRAAVPLFTHDLSYINQALIRPIVAYINSRRTFIPINCRIVKRAIEFDGSWTIYDSGLMEDLSAETYEAFAKDVVDSQARMRRLKKVGIWSISLVLQGLFYGLAGNVA